MSKEPLRTFINKVGTFRGKKAANQRPSTSDLKYAQQDGQDESMFKVPYGIDENAAPYAHDSTCHELDMTTKSMSGGTTSFRSNTLSSLPFTNIYDRMTDEEINNEFEKSLLSILNLKSDKDKEKMLVLPVEQKKKLLINMRRNDNEMDDKPTSMAASLKHALKESRNLRDNLKPLLKIIKRIGVCIAHKPVTWLQEFDQANGLADLQDIVLDCKTKYSTLFNNNSTYQYYNSMNTTMMPMSGTATLGHGSGFGTISSAYSQFGAPGGGIGSGSSSSEFKDKDTQLTKEIRFECMKILKSFVNTSYGIKVALENKKTIMAIATAVDYNDAPSMNVACLILAVLAVLDHDKVLSAIGEAAKFTGKHRFHSIVSGLTINEDKEIKASCMLLINALIGNADNLDFKIHLRSDFARCGLIQAIEVGLFYFLSL